MNEPAEPAEGVDLLAPALVAAMHKPRRLRRALAWIVDASGFLLAFAPIVPQALAVAWLDWLETSQGIGIFDPTVGGDPILFAIRQTIADRFPIALALALVWLVALAAIALKSGRSLGQRASGLMLSRSDGERASGMQALRREVPRASLFLASIVAGGAVRLDPPVPSGRLLVLLGTWLVGLALLTLVDVVLVLRDPAARTFGDRFAGTRVDVDRPSADGAQPAM